MKKLVLLFAAAVLVVSGILFADVFASRIKFTNPDGNPFDGKFNDGSGLKVWYILNDTATSVELKVYNAATNASVVSVITSPQGKGLNSVTWDGNGSVSGQKYYFRLSTTQKVRSETNYTSFYFQQTAGVENAIGGIFTRGVDINNNMDSRGFGYWYASNSDAGSTGYLTGLLRYNPDGSFAGTQAGHPMLTNTLGTANGGTFNWSTFAPWTSAVDSKGRIYQVSNGGNFVTRVDNDSAAPKIIISNIKSPRGIFIMGEGANLKLYIAADTVVWRADIGNSDTLTAPLVLVASLGLYVRDVVIDDAGFLLVTLRSGVTGIAPGYIERYDISGSLPINRIGATLSITHSSGLPVCFAIQRGPDKNSAIDDTVYYSIRGANATDTANLGIHQITNIDGFFEAKRIFKSGDVEGSIGGNNNANADLALDWAGNIVWFENSNEEIFMITPPRSGAVVTRTTKGYDTISVLNSLSVNNEGSIPKEFSLNQNYPNPFNPSTQISYTLPTNAKISVVVYDILGNIVNDLFTGDGSQGYNVVTWNGTNNSGVKVSSGMYLYRLTAQLSDGRSFTDAKRMLLLK